MSPRQNPSGKKGITMKHAVQSFSVSKSLLLTKAGTVCVEYVQYCYRVKKELKRSYIQWRIIVTPDRVDVKLQYKNGVIREYVTETRFPDAADWVEIVGYYVWA